MNEDELREVQDRSKEGRVTYADFHNLLEHVVNATEKDGVIIKGNPELELGRAKTIMQLEDVLDEGYAKVNITYVREYEHMYKHLR